jgi:DNA-binding NarL/FixJ family response regulator
VVSNGHDSEPTTIVIADDHAVFREGTRRLLEEESDLTVIGEAATGLEAVVAVKELHRSRRP